MRPLKHNEFTRRGILRGLAALPFVGLFARLGQAGTLELTPEIPDDDEPTPSQTEGPFYKRSTPKRTSLREKGFEGKALVVEGNVVDTKGKPVAGALLDFWHCDAEGDYDNAGFKGRGHQFADADGKFKLETIVPGEYPGRTRHIHVRVQPPNGRILTTQLYFPGEARNDRDGIYDKRLLMKMKEAEGARQGQFRFVVAL
ncbi:MAG TPA: hypothetical protein PLX06_11630 [Fimbriimonadaceae bacterium]|mgnify:CR=1 FL=1|nr:hypothetical protein [Fimbriimonadaceae bacterium]